MDKILYPIEVVVAWIMYLSHEALTWVGMDPASGATWGLSIVVLVIVMRIILIPLFFKQIHAARGMQMLAPEMQVIQKKYKGKSDSASREAMSRETMALYKKHGTNPFSSCLPMLAQSPIFFALFRVLNALTKIGAGTQDPIGPLVRSVASQAEKSQIFGAPLSATFTRAGIDPSLATSTRVVTIVLIVAMSATTFLTQRQLTMKNMPKAALEGQMAQQQKVLLYVMPLVFAFSGIQFPIGVLLYWTTTNLWSMGQQFYSIRRMPVPGSQAERLMLERKARKAKARGEVVDPDGGTTVVESSPSKGQRQQPVRKDRTRSKSVQPEAGATDAPRKPAAPRTADGATRPAAKRRPVAPDAKGRPGKDAPPTASTKPKK